MQVINAELFDEYKGEVDQNILGAFKQNETVFNSVHESHLWHLESQQKRFVYFLIYGLLLKDDAPRMRILDVGGGITSLTTLLSRKHDYSLMDIGVDPGVKDIGDLTVISKDWYDYDIKGETWDLVIANDIFPNVDQRLDLFLQKFLRHCGGIMMSLTYHNRGPKWYKTKRVDGTETLHMLAWTGVQLSDLLDRYRGLLDSEEPQTEIPLGLVKVRTGTESIFPNGRQVCIVKFKGDLYNG